MAAVNAIEIASEICFNIARSRIQLSDGRCNWLGASWHAEAGWKATTSSLGPSLYDGTAGIALFLAAMHYETGVADFADAARGALSTAESFSQRVPEAFRSSFYLGWSGVAWTQKECGKILDDSALVRRGQELMRAAAGIDASISALDLLQGSASAAVTFLNERKTGDESLFREAAQAHADHLKRSAERQNKVCSWPLGSERSAPHLCGLSHGAAGIAIALLSVWRELGDQEALDIAREALNYEELHFSFDHGSWRDLREESGGFPILWCHGAGGGALAHGIAAELAPPEDEIWIDHLHARRDMALKTVLSALESIPGNDSLCHGLWGLVSCCRTMGAAVPQKVVDAGLQRLVARGLKSGVSDGRWTPNLMLGAAGVGLALLELSDRTHLKLPLLPPGLR